MSFKSIPFRIVLLASVLPWFAAAFNSKVLTYVPDMLAIIAYGFFIVISPERSLRFKKGFTIVLLLVLIHVAFGLASGRGIGSGGLVALFVLTFIFSKLMDAGLQKQSAAAIASHIGLIYMIHIVFILIELIVCMSGYTDILVAIAGHATDVAKYKDYNSAMLLHYIGFDDLSGMNSLLLGSQSASQLVLFTFFVFAPLYKGYPLTRGGLPSRFWAIIALVLFPFVASMTAVLIFVIFIIFMIYVLPNSTLNRSAMWTITPFIVTVFGGTLLTLLAFRIRQEGDWVTYMDAFMASPLRFLELPLIDQIMGFGSNMAASNIGTGDFGIGMITFQAGFYLVGLAFACLIWIIYAVVRAIRRNRVSGSIPSPWATLAGINVACAIGWAASLVHYTPAVELGGRHLFALHLAVCLVSLWRLPNSRRPMVQIILKGNELAGQQKSSPVHVAG